MPVISAEYVRVKNRAKTIFELCDMTVKTVRCRSDTAGANRFLREEAPPPEDTVG